MSRHSSRRNQSLDRNPGPPPGGSRGDIGSPSGISSSIERGNGSDLEAYSVPIHTIGAAIVCIVSLTGPGNNLTARVADLSRDFARSVLASERSPGIPGASIRPRQTSRRRISGSAFIGYARWKKRGREGSRKRGRDREREERTGSNVRPFVRPSVRSSLLGAKPPPPPPPPASAFGFRRPAFPPVRACVRPYVRPRGGVHPEQEAPR